MNQIKILSEELINKIAAGEVVERPASVVKELVENSVDAQATQIEIETREGGRKLIRVVDNGRGMDSADVKLAFSRHATSKISSAEDLFNISSLGFRGEALPSIASVSKVEIVTKTKDSANGTKLLIDSGEIKEAKDTPANIGTIVSVYDLFYNTPARRKFLKSEVTENRHIIDLVTNFALAYPSVSFKLKIDNREVLNLNSTATLSQRVREVVGKETFLKMLEIKKEPNEVQVGGFLGKPEVSKASRGEIRFFVNGRIISNRSLLHAVQLGYGELLPKGKYPLIYLFLEVTPHLVDVNVHPQKLEVRFANERQVHDLVYLAIKKTLSSTMVMPVYEAVGEKTLLPTMGGERPGLVRESLENYISKSSSVETQQKTILKEIFDRKFEPEIVPTEKTEDYYGITNFWQLANTYILAAVKESLIVMDQHTAHERILYEEATKNLTSKKPAVQQLLFPQSLELTPLEFSFFDENLAVWEELGFEVKPLGGKTVVVSGVPSGIRNKNSGNFFKEILTDLSANFKPGNDRIKAITSTFACKAAVKAGDKLTTEEMNSLFDRLFATENPYICPHGRPTLIRIPIEEINHKFGRP
ncbi:MAG TPA: DNA mismatch repair endonuclease MutL [candidate division Zixibacteria bacterium]|nr:DNA mismatch repair endonuclease MutL [candidate division Zixibacteria bacterium]